MNKQVVAFVPVLYAGYLKFFRRHPDARLSVLGKDLYGEFEHLTREIRALEPEEVLTTVESLQIFKNGVGVVNRKDLWDLINMAGHPHFVLPDEDISRHIAKKYFTEHDLEFESVFLRFDMPKSLSKRPPESDRSIPVTHLDRDLMLLAENESKRSPDWWRQVGAVAVKNGIPILTAHNTHMPSEHSLYALGDPRGNFVPGQHLDITCAHHAERSIISETSRLGIATQGCYLYVSVFPCPSCAYSVIKAGFSRIYYREGYSSVEADATCKAYGVELVHVEDESK